MTEYILKKDYYNNSLGFPIKIPKGSKCSWFEHAGVYVFHIGMYCPYVTKWAVEAWKDIFELVVTKTTK